MGETGDDMQALAHPLVAYLGFYDKVWGSVEKCGKWKARVDSACRLGLGFRFRFYPMHRPPLPPSPSPPPSHRRAPTVTPNWLSWAPASPCRQWIGC